MTKLGNPDVIYQDSTLKLSWFWRRIFLGVLPYMGMVAILFYDAEQFEQIDNMPSTEGPKCNLGKIGQAVSDKKMFKDYEIVYMYIAQVL